MKDVIKVLDERQKCRDKVAIWFGSRDNFIHPFREALANAIDEIINNFDNGEIHVTRNMNLITVKDSGRGIPIEGKTNGVDNYKLLFLTLFAGTNYDNAFNKKYTTGTNGVGNTVSCYCSSFFKVVSYRNNKKYTLVFENGGYLKDKMTIEDGYDGEHGTEISFILDKEVFGEYEYNSDELEDIIKSCAGVNSKIRFTYSDSKKSNEYYYNNIEQFFSDECNNNTCEMIVGAKKTYENDVYISSNNLEEDNCQLIKETDHIELVLTTSSTPIQKSYLNITYLSEGGTINKGIIYGVKDFVNNYAQNKRLLNKKLGKVSNNDVEESISFVCNMLSTVVEFTNQTKLSTDKSLYQKIAKEYVMEVLETELIERPKNIEKFVKHILEVQEFNNKAQTSKKKLKAKLSSRVDNISNRVEKLTDCKNHGKDSEIFIAEGDSAKGSIVQARDASFQACLAIRGKITNVLKRPFMDIFDSKIVVDIIKCLGCGIETTKKYKDLGEFDINSLRYGKIILATDADADGFQIQCLLLSLFYRLTPTLIKKGYIYIAMTPLYEVKLKDGNIVYWFSEEEKENYIEEYTNENIKSMSRCKGLGEMDAKILSETGVHPDTRNIVQVTVEDAKMMDEMFEIWMGNKADKRFEILSKELNKYSEDL